MSGDLAPGAASADVRARARKGLRIYFLVVGVVSAAIEGWIIASGDLIDRHPWAVMALMWTPTLGSIAARVALREGIRDVSFRFGGMRGLWMLLLAWCCPLVVGFVAYGTAWLTGLETFAVPASAAANAQHMSPALVFGLSVATSATIVTVFSAITAAGEEFGWRGYMLTRLIDAGVPRPILVSGLIWGAWHLPLIVTGRYAAGPYPLFSAFMFAISITAAAYVVARVRLESGSVWPAVMFHAAWNAIIQGSFDVFTKGGNAAHGTAIWTGESGILVVVVSLVFSVLVMLKPWPARRHPAEPPMAELGLRNA